MSQALKSSAINPFLFMKIKQLCFVSGVALATLGTSAAQAALVVVPPGLNPGDQYRLVFVTDGTRNATSTNINDYNNFVTNQVTGSALATQLTTAGFNLGTITWKAIGSTSATSAKVNTGTDGTQPDVPIYLIDGNRVANDNADLWLPPIIRPINVTQAGSTLGTEVVWTGTNSSGVVGGSNGLGGSFAITGVTNLSTANWIQNSITLRTSLRRLYGMSSVLTKPTPPVLKVPEPSSLLGFITLGGLMLGGAVRKARK